MARAISSQFRDALSAGQINPAIFLHLEFSATTLYLWNGIGTLDYNGNSYLGNGWFQGHSVIKEDGQTVPTGISVTLSGVPSSLLSIILNQSVENKVGSLSLGFLDDNGNLIQDPYVMYKGKLDVPLLTEDAVGPEISITIENRVLDMDRPRTLRYTKQSQKQVDLFDKGFDYVADLQNFDGYWGSKKDTLKKRRRRKRKRRNRRKRE